MEVKGEDWLGFGPGSDRSAPSMVSLSPFTPIPAPSSRRLSSHFIPSRPVTSSAGRLAWVSLQGRLVNAEEASSAKAIGGGLGPEETLAWHLFTPIQRFLIVAVIGAAVSESRKNRIISQLTKSVEIRDEVLSSMQQKLDNLCQQLNQGGARYSVTGNKNVESPSRGAFGGCDKNKFVDCGCWICDQHQDLVGVLVGNFAVKASKGDEVLQYKSPLVNEVEQDERRMSDLSDWAPSVTSSVETQMYAFAIEQDCFDLKRECEGKDATIKELTSVLQSTNLAGSKRIAELEDIIRRKNSMITRLKKDLVVLEQKVVQLTRLRRPSSTVSVPDGWDLPLMVDNIVYDMNNTTSPSSSDSDSSPASRPQAIQLTPVQNGDLALRKSQKLLPVEASSSLVTPVHNEDLASRNSQKSAPAVASSSLAMPTKRYTKPGPASPRQEVSVNQQPNRPFSLRPKQISSGGDFKRVRRRTQSAVKDLTPRRWV